MATLDAVLFSALNARS